MQGVTSDIIVLRQGTPGAALMCMHYGNFLELAAAWGADVAIYALKPRWQDSAIDITVAQLAAAHIDQIRSVQARGPYVLLGYSFGGLVAYEVALQLLRAGDQIALLALFDTPNPEFHRNLSASERDAVRKKYLADRKEKYLGSVRRGRIDLLALDIFKWVKRAAASAALKLIQVLGRFSVKPPLGLSDDMRADAMWNTYSPPPSDVPILLFRAQGRDGEFGDDLSMGWQRVVSGSVDVHFVQGIHETMMSRATLAEQVMPFFAKARA